VRRIDQRWLARAVWSALESLPENRPAQVKHPVFNERVQWFADETTPSSASWRPLPQPHEAASRI